MPQYYSTVRVPPEELYQQYSAFEAAYFYFVYKMECGVRDPADRAIATGCRGSDANKGVATFDEFIRHVIPPYSNYGPSEHDVSMGRLDTLSPDVDWIGDNLCWDYVGYSGCKAEHLHTFFTSWEPPDGVVSRMAIADVHDAVGRTLAACCAQTGPAGELVYPLDHEDRLAAYDALELSLQRLRAAGFKSLAEYLKHLEAPNESGAPRESGLGLREGETRNAPPKRPRAAIRLYAPETRPEEMPAEQREFWLQTDAPGHPPRAEILNRITDSMRWSLGVASGAADDVHDADDEGAGSPEEEMSPISI